MRSTSGSTQPCTSLPSAGSGWRPAQPIPDIRTAYERYEALASLLIGMLLLVAVGVIVASAVARSDCRARGGRGRRLARRLVVRSAADVLTDAAVVDTDAIEAAALRVPGVRDCHSVRSRGEAGHVRVDLHIHVDPALTVVAGHQIALAVEDRIRQLDLGIAEVLVHVGAAAPRSQIERS